MDDKILSATECSSCTESVCINASEIYDSCRAKECLENLRVYFSPESQETINSASKITAEKAEITVGEGTLLVILAKKES